MWRRAPIMTAVSKRSLTFHSCWISVVLLLVFLQILTSLVYCAGVFITSSEVLISPFFFCHTSQHGELHCGSPPAADFVIQMNIVTLLVTCCLYVPVVLVAFALLALLLAAYAKDRTTLKFCTACQTSSSVLMLIGVVAFLLQHQSYVSWRDMTLGFYLCVGVQVQLVITTLLTRLFEKTLTSDWE